LVTVLLPRCGSRIGGDEARRHPGPGESAQAVHHRTERQLAERRQEAYRRSESQEAGPVEEHHPKGKVVLQSVIQMEPSSCLRVRWYLQV